MNPLLLYEIIWAVASTIALFFLCRHCYRNGHRDGLTMGRAEKIIWQFKSGNMSFEDLDPLKPYLLNPPNDKEHTP